MATPRFDVANGHARIAALGLFALLALIALSASAIVTSAEDRDNATPTAWWHFYGVTGTEAANFANSTGGRIVDLQVDSSASPRRFSGAMVHNSGAYLKSWWWYYDVDAATVASALSANNARLISLKAYDIGGGQLRFAVVMIPNTGADQKGWWWHYGLTFSDVANVVAQNNARLTQLNAYLIGGVVRYAVVMVSNTGADQRGWWWYTNASAAAVTSAINSNNARLVDLDRDPVSGNYNVIMNSCAASCPHWWWYTASTQQQMLDNAAQTGSRIIDIVAFPGCGSTCLSYVLINNANDITTRVGEMLRGGTDGTKGLYLKQVGGPVLASLNEAWVFEPASTLKAAPHLRAMNRVQAGTATLTQNVTMYSPPESGSCPGNTNAGTEPLQTALGEMMRHSDNTRTREVVDAFGQAAITTYVQSVGMANTQINHVFGCGGPTANRTTLTDLGILYEGVADGTLLNATNRATFWSLMPGKAQFQLEGYDWTGLWMTDIPNMINAEAPPGMSFAVKSAFQNRMNLAYKAGNYKLCGGTCATYVDHVSIAGWAQIPFCNGSTIGSKEFVFGTFLNNSTSDTTSASTFNATRSELLREQIREGLASCMTANKTLDIDGNMRYDALTDGLLLIRYLFNISGTNLTSGVIGANATRSTPAATQQYMDLMRLVLDVDGNGQADALTDGIMLLRYIFNLRGNSLVNGAIGLNATRTTAAQIEPFLQSMVP